MSKPKSATLARPALVVLDFEKRRREAHNRETFDILDALRDEAAKGEVNGIALCFKSPNGMEHCVVTGTYEDNPAAAVNAAMRMCWQMLQIQGVTDELPQ